MIIGPANDFDGYCNECTPNEHGAMPIAKRRFLIRIGAMSFRLCDLHARELVMKLGREVGR